MPGQGSLIRMLNAPFDALSCAVDLFRSATCVQDIGHSSGVDICMDCSLMRVRV